VVFGDLSHSPLLPSTLRYLAMWRRRARCGRSVRSNGRPAWPLIFNHTIVWARDSEASATFLAQILGLPAPGRWGPFLVVATHNGVNVDFMNADGEITPQHYAFLVTESEFDEIFD